MKKRLVFSLVMFVCVTTTKVEASRLEPHEIYARGAVIMDMDSGRVLWEKNGRETLSMASTTKIMTAIIALENSDLSETVTVSSRASIAPKVKMYLTKGEKISLEGLLYALMLQSSNDAAVAVAEHVGGTVEDFCYMMSIKAKELGALDTSFETPNGLDSENHFSTAYDLAIITRYALKNEKFVKIINTGYYSVTSDKRNYDIRNKNRFLNEYDGAFGVKTGFTGEAGNCFVGACERDGMKIITVVLASGWGDLGKEQKWIDTKKMMEYAFGNYKYQNLIHEGDKAGITTVSRSKTTEMPLYFSEEIDLPMTNEEKEKIEMVKNIPENIEAPIKAGEYVGNVKLFTGGDFLAETEVFASGNAERHDFETSLKKTLKYFLDITTGHNSINHRLSK